MDDRPERVAAGQWDGYRMTPEPFSGLSAEDRHKLRTLNLKRLSASGQLAYFHFGITHPDLPAEAFDDLTSDEQGSAILEAYPWFLAARAVYFGGCPRCGGAPGDIIDLGDSRKRCPDCEHEFEFVDED
jgi:hypothetical protein